MAQRENNRRPGPAKNRNRSGPRKLKFYHHGTRRKQWDCQLRNYVTDHAVLRYLERVYGLDMNALREEILGNELPVVKAFEESGRIVRRDHVLVCVNRRVITVRPTNTPG